MIRIAAVLPEKERFCAAGAGAVALMLRDMARAGPADTVFSIIGPPPLGTPFAGCRFTAAAPNRLVSALAGRRLAYARAVLSALRREAPDIVQVHNRPALARALARALSPVPVILSLHNHADTMRGGRSPGQRRALAEALGTVVCISEHVRGRFLDGLPDRLAGKVVTIHRGLCLGTLPQPLPPAARRREILYVGRLNAEKGADVFVRAAALALPSLPGWSARMIGGAWFGADAPQTPFVAALRGAAAVAGVELAGFLPNDEALAAMAEAAIVVLPSRWSEPFARVALEALACGAALVASPRGGIPEAAGEAALYADPDDPASLAEAMCRVAAEDGLHEDLHRRALAQAARFPMAATAAAYAALRERLLGVVAGG
jgi:glycosyltransferase involved in cell wall biosynthesis